MRTAAVRAALALAIAVTTQVAVADSAPPAATMWVTVASGGAEPVTSIRSLGAAEMNVVTSKLGANAMVRKHMANPSWPAPIEVVYAALPSGPTVAWAVLGSEGTAQGAIAGGRSLLSATNAAGEVVFPAVGPGQSSAPITLRIWPQTLTTTTSASPAAAPAQPTAATSFDATFFNAQFIGNTTLITAVGPLDTMASTFTIVVKGRSTMNPVPAGWVEYASVDRSVKRRVSWSSGATTASVVAPADGSSTQLTFQTSFH